MVFYAGVSHWSRYGDGEVRSDGGAGGGTVTNEGEIWGVQKASGHLPSGFLDLAGEIMMKKKFLLGDALLLSSLVRGGEVLFLGRDFALSDCC